MITQQDIERAKARMELLTGFTAEEHHKLIYETALAWLQWACGSLPGWVARFEGSPVFWAWWRQQWNLRNYALYAELGLDDIDSFNAREQAGLLQLFQDKHRLCYRVRPAAVLVRSILNETQTEVLEVKGEDASFVSMTKKGNRPRNKCGVTNKV